MERGFQNLHHLERGWNVDTRIYTIFGDKYAPMIIILMYTYTFMYIYIQSTYILHGPRPEARTLGPAPGLPGYPVRPIIAHLAPPNGLWWRLVYARRHFLIIMDFVAHSARASPNGLPPIRSQKRPFGELQRPFGATKRPFGGPAAPIRLQRRPFGSENAHSAAIAHSAQSRVLLQTCCNKSPPIRRIGSVRPKPNVDSKNSMKHMKFKHFSIHFRKAE